MTKTIRISNEVESYLKEYGKFGESPNDVLKRNLKNFGGNEMYKVDLFTCLKKDSIIIEIFRKVLDLPFIPTIGMSFHQGINCEIWEPVYFRGEGKLPVIKRVFWSLDDEMFIVRLSDIVEELNSNFWLKCGEPSKLRYFSHYLEEGDIILGMD